MSASARALLLGKFPPRACGVMFLQRLANLISCRYLIDFVVVYLFGDVCSFC